MSWMQKLCEAYDAGIVCDQSKESVMLVPVGFVRKTVKFHVVLTRDGQFVSADGLMDEAQFQVIPSTPQAESRTGGNGVPYPLVEQLQYLVYEDNNLSRFGRYMEQLNAWCEQPDAPDCLRAVYTYLDGHTLLGDLESQPGLKLKYYKNGEKQEGIGEDTKARVCFSVQMQDESNDDLWLRADVKQSWSNYLADKVPGARKFCYVEGKMLPSVEHHPKLQGNAKLISAKDTEFPLQYKGRFRENRSAALVSFDSSMRAHNALTWLITRQGMQRYGMIWVIWNTNGSMMRVPLDEKNNFIEEEEDEDTVSKPVINTFAAYAREVNTAACGYGNKLHDFNPERTNCAVILGLEAASDGRMSVTYYQECPGNEYIGRLEDWYWDCCWWHYSRKDKTKRIATPYPNDIAIAVMGIDAVHVANGDVKCDKSHTKLMRKLQSRILACIVDKQPLPPDVVRSAFYRGCTPLSFVIGKERKWSRSAWENSVDTACAMISCFQKRGNGKFGEVFFPELQTDSRKPDYLYGRLLAVADFVEEKALEDGRDYPTNAVRLMQRFVQRPFETWPKIHEKLIPSFRKLGSYGAIYQALIGDIEQLFSGGDRYERGELSLEFLQGFSSQRQRLYQRWVPFVREDEGTVLYELPKRRSELYGCLLAIADAAEQNAGKFEPDKQEKFRAIADDAEQKAGKGERTCMTNAMQMMSVFAARPYESWGRLHDKVLPYLGKLGERAGYYQWLFGIVEMQFTQLDRESTGSLDGSYLHGYYCMRQALYQKAQFSGEAQTWTAAKDMRSALYGQMLGIGDRLERRRLIGEEDIDKRLTNEMRFMTVFAQKPASTWEMLKVKLRPYQRYAGGCAEKECAALEQVEVQLQQHGWNINAPLGSIYLHDYYKERN